MLLETNEWIPTYRVVLKPGSFNPKYPGTDYAGLDLEKILSGFLLDKGLVTNPSKDCCTLIPISGELDQIFIDSGELNQFISNDGNGNLIWLDGAIVEPNTALAFTPNVPFAKSYIFMAPYQVSAPIEFTTNLVDSIPGAVTMVKLVADGVNVPTFNSITEINTSAGYDNTLNILNYLVFFFDGVKVLVNIFQDVNAQPVDIIPPVLQTAVIGNSIRNKLVLTYDEVLNSGVVPSTADFSIPGKTINSVTVVGSTVNLFVTIDFAYNTVYTVSYTPSMAPIQDASGNTSVAFSNHAVTNNIAAPDLVAPVLATATIENANLNKIILTYNEDLNASIIPATTNFTVSGGKTVTNVAIVNGVVTLTVNSNYATGDVITVSYVPGTNKLQDPSGNLAIALTNQSVTNNIAAAFTTVAWENLANATDSGGYINYQGAVSGGRGTVSIDPTLPFEVIGEFTSLSPATVMFLDKDATNVYVWGGSQAFEAGCYYFGSGANYTTDGSTFIEFDAAFTLPTWLKLRKSSNDIILSRCPTENGTYTDVHTFTGALTSLSVLYIHVLFAANGAGDKIRVKYKIG